MYHQRTLLLAPWFFPIKILPWQAAVKMIYEGTADVVVEYDEEIRSPSVTWKMPAVIRLRKLKHDRNRAVKFSRANVYERDRYACQYCRKKFPARALSYDHVIPRSQGGRTVWTNIVTSCKTCNTLKDNKSCDEAGMWPMQDPYRPRTLPLAKPIIDPDRAPPEWNGFVDA